VNITFRITQKIVNPQQKEPTNFWTTLGAMDLSGWC